MPEKAEEKTSADIADQLQTVAGLLDLHLEASREVKKSSGTERWPALKAATFILGSSLVLWALIFAVIYYLF